MFSLWFFTVALPFALAYKEVMELPANGKEVMELPADGAFCCDESKNLVINGHFENVYANFYSSYAHDSDILPGQYDVTSDASEFATTLTDHSYCESPLYYPKNNKYLLVNGLTNQPAGSKSIIWRQKLEKLSKKKRYRFCANFRNLKQCTHDVLPVVTVQLSTGFSQTVKIDTDQDDACDWQQVSFCFSAGSDISITIMLKESSLGDGNDLAIDDISVQELSDPQLTVTVQYQFNTNEVLASLNTISTMDDSLPKECGGQYYWFVLTVQSYSGGKFTVNWSAPNAWGNSMVSIRINPYTVGPAWQLSTKFPGFPFLSSTMYAVGMVTPECCEGCLAMGETYHIVFPSFFKTWNQDKPKILEKPGNIQGETMGEDMYPGEAQPNIMGEELYTTDYGLTDKDLLDVEEWVGTSDRPKL